MANYLAGIEVFDIAQIVNMKKQFRAGYNQVVQEEKAVCEKEGRPTISSPERTNEVMDLLDKCGTPWHIEALKRLVLVRCIIPTKKQLDEYAHALRMEATGGQVSIGQI